MSVTVAALERALLGRFPLSDAEAWDRVGLSVGDPAREVTGVACALDVTPGTIASARERGCSVLLTHHPVCLEMPRLVAPARSGAPTPSSSLWQAVEDGVALIALHTNLDRSREGAAALPRALGMEPCGSLEGGRPGGAGSLGALVELPGRPSAGEVARLARERLGRLTQVFGDLDAPVSRLGFYNGSMGSQGCADVAAAGCDAVVCGECGYHRALDLASVGRAVIILGHDVSELPMVGVLADAARACGVPGDRVVALEEPLRWRQP